jgi:hypothetical protein
MKRLIGSALGALFVLGIGTAFAAANLTETDNCRGDVVSINNAYDMLKGHPPGDWLRPQFLDSYNEAWSSGKYCNDAMNNDGTDRSPAQVQVDTTYFNDNVEHKGRISS